MEQQPLADRVAQDMARYTENAKRSKKSTIFKKLAGKIRGWITTYGVQDGGDNVTVSVLASDFKKAFTSNGKFDLYNVNRGLLGLASAVLNNNMYVVTICIARVRLEGGVRVNPKTAEKKLNEKHLFVDDQARHRSPWTAPRGCDADAACPNGFGEAEARVVAVEGKFLESINRLRELWRDAPNCDATVATRTTLFSLETDSATAGAMRELKGFYGVVVNTLAAILRDAGEAEARVTCAPVKPYVEQLAEFSCDPFFWGMLKRADPDGTRKWSLRTQLDQFIHKENLIAIVDREKQQTDARDKERLERLERFLGIVREGGINAQLQHWVGDVYDANKSRRNKYNKAADDTARAKSKPPKTRGSARIGAIPLTCARRGDLANVFRVFGFTSTGVRGYVRRGEIGAEGSLHRLDCDLSKMSTEERSDLIGDCTLIRRSQRARDSRGVLVYVTDYVMAFTTRAAPVMARPPSCLGSNGEGPVVAIDLGGRANTAVHVSQEAQDAAQLTFCATEHCQGLNQEILRRGVKWQSDLDNAGQSRSERLTDPLARRNAQKLETSVAAKEATAPAGAPRDWRLQADRRHLRIVRRHGAMGDEFVTELEKTAQALEEALEEGPEASTADADVSAVLGSLGQEVAGPVAQQRDVKRTVAERREENKRMYGDEHLGPLWTAEVEERYSAFAERRYDAEKTIPTRREFLKYKVEKRLRRRAKWRKWRMRGKVRNVQNAELKAMVPVGTSFVFCGRLNFLGFHLSKAIMMYFSFLSLAAYHTRIRTWCENIGAVLVSVSEGFTTKKCPRCGVHVNVGSAEVFQCMQCGFRRHRDIKVRSERQ